MNVADTERALTGLRAAGYELAESAKSADVLLLNTCSIRERAAQKVFTRIGEVRRERRGGVEPLIGIMGCVAQLEGEALFEQTADVRMVVGTSATDRLPALIERVLSGEEEQTLDLGERAPGESWNVASVERHSRYVAFVPIIEGCNKFCTYCIVPYSRGREKSRTPWEILAEVRSLRAEGYKEIHLIGQNVNSYRPKSMEGLEDFKGATPFSRLLRAVASTGMERVKFTTSFPRDFHADIVAALEEHENLCDWVHLPVQSGSDRILRAMRRGHTAADYLRRVEAIKKSGRRLSLTSDMIVGFPGETTEDFALTMDLVRECQYDSLYIFKYSARKGTPASQMLDDVSLDEKRERFLELERLQREIQRKIYADYVGREVEVLAERVSARSPSDLTGHTTCQKVVNFPADETLKGQILRIRVSQAKTNSLYGQVLEKSAHAA